LDAPLSAIVLPDCPYRFTSLRLRSFGIFPKAAFGNIPVPFDLFRKIAVGLLSAGSRFQEIGLSHCDLKPENVMMDNLTPIVIDFGAVVNFGGEVIEYTPGYSLDADTKCVSPQFDLFCIITTLVRCFLPSFSLITVTKEGLTNLLHPVSNDHKLKCYAEICLSLLKLSSSQQGLSTLLIKGLDYIHL
jgi:serine/threonine protein kinase